VRAVAIAAFEVLEAGLQTTVQDLGRAGFEHLGVPHAGAADPRALAAANWLAGNEPGAAALECTLLGPELLARRSITVALAGADMGAVALPSGRALATLRHHRIEAGERLAFTIAGDPDIGCRAYLAIAGGIDVPVVLDSRSTSLVGGFGGLDGRALRAGDVLAAGPSGSSAPRERLERHVLPRIGAPVRVLAGPAARGGGGQARFEQFVATTWFVSGDSDRRGLRLEPAPGQWTAAGSDPATGREPPPGPDRSPHGVVPGAIQVTPSGQPLVLMPDAGTTGGYPVIAVAMRADLGILGQLVPGSAIRFEAVDLEAAAAADRARG
jgi:biotin-dependent carboxylase-like uncharacterized protein